MIQGIKGFPWCPLTFSMLCHDTKTVQILHIVHMNRNICTHTQTFETFRFYQTSHIHSRCVDIMVITKTSKLKEKRAFCSRILPSVLFPWFLQFWFGLFPCWSSRFMLVIILSVSHSVFSSLLRFLCAFCHVEGYSLNVCVCATKTSLCFSGLTPPVPDSFIWKLSSSAVNSCPTSHSHPSSSSSSLQQLPLL